LAYALPTAAQEEEDKSPTTSAGGTSVITPTSATPQAVVQSTGASGVGAGKSSPTTGQAGATPTGGGTATTGTGEVSESKPSSSGLFTNLSAYLNANPNGGSEVEKLAADPINSAVSTGNTALNASNTGFNNAVKSGTDTYNPNLVNGFVQNPSGTSAANVSKLETQLAGTYSGPSSFEGSGYGTSAQTAVQNAQQQAQLAGTQGGQQQLLEEQNANNPSQYTQGGLQLDQFLMGASPTATKALSTAAGSALPLASNFAKDTTANDANVTKAQTTSANTGADTKQDILNAENTMQTNLTNQANADKTNATNQYNALKTALTSANNWDPTKINTAITPDKTAVTNAQNTVNQLQSEIAAAQKAGSNTVSTTRTINIGNESGRGGGNRTITTQIPLATAQAQLAAAQTTLNNANAALTKVENTQPGALTPAQLSQLGITNQQFINLLESNYASKDAGGKGVDLSSFLTAPNTAAITPSSIATQADVANWNALNAVVPGTNTQFLSGATGNPTISPATFNDASATTTLAAQIQSSSQAQKILSAEQSATKAAEQTTQNVSVIGGVVAGAELGAQIGSIVPGIGNVIGAVVGGIVGGIVGLFACFEAGTPILMEDWTYKNVEDLRLGDMTMMGGMVMGCGQNYTNQLYSYKQTKLSGEHTVFEDGVWMKVSDSKHAELLDTDHLVVVYPIVTEKHILVTSTFVSADLVEVEDPHWELSQEQRLFALNNAIERNNKITEAWNQIQAMNYSKVG
jgi:hypothetical protein